MNIFISIVGFICALLGGLVICVIICSIISQIKDFCIKSYNKNKKKTYIIKYTVDYPVVRCNGDVKVFKYEFSEHKIVEIVVRGKNKNDAIRRMNHNIVVCCSLIIISITETETI